MTLDNTTTYHIVITLDYKNKTTYWKSLIIKRSRVQCCKSSYTHQTNQKKKIFLNSVTEIGYKEKVRRNKQVKKRSKERNVKYLLKSYYCENLMFSKLKLQFSKLKKFVTLSVFEELQLMQISLNFKNFCANLEIRGLRAKLCVAFLFRLLF